MRCDELEPVVWPRKWWGPISKEGQERDGLQDALNDILFILLMFFLIVSTLANPNVIKLSQPKSKSDTKAKQNVVVSIDEKLVYYVGTTKVPVDSLYSSLLPVIQKEKTEIPTIVSYRDEIWFDIHNLVIPSQQPLPPLNNLALKRCGPMRYGQQSPIVCLNLIRLKIA